MNMAWNETIATAEQALQVAATLNASCRLRLTVVELRLLAEHLLPLIGRNASHAEIEHAAGEFYDWNIWPEKYRDR
jgi:hypothetical protein